MTYKEMYIAPVVRVISLSIETAALQASGAVTGDRSDYGWFENNEWEN